MFEKLRQWLIKLVVGKTPIIMNVHFLEGFVLARENLGSNMLIAGCTFEVSTQPSYMISTSANGGNDMLFIYEAETDDVQA